MIAKYYYEAHVTIDPVFDDRREAAHLVANKYQFKLAKLLMDKGLSKLDTFMTGHAKNLTELQTRLVGLVNHLHDAGFVVWSILESMMTME